jgi:hypothetical protein
MRWAATLAALVACAASGCGGGDDRPEPPSGSRTPAEARTCLRQDDFDVRGSKVNVREDPDAPDYVLIVSGHGPGVQIAFYDDLDRAEKLEPELRKGAKRFRGEVERAERATIVWAAKPDAAVRERVRRCVFDYGPS